MTTNQTAGIVPPSYETHPSGTDLTTTKDRTMNNMMSLMIRFDDSDYTVVNDILDGLRTLQKRGLDVTWTRMVSGLSLDFDACIARDVIDTVATAMGDED